MVSGSERKGLVERLDEDAVDLRRGVRLRARAAGLPAGGRVRPRGRARASRRSSRQLHRDFVHAGSDVVEALTYYAHREKLRVIGTRARTSSRINRQALAIAKEVADETGTLLAGDICNTNVYVDGGRRVARGRCATMFEEQVGWAVDAGVDFVIGETFSWGAGGADRARRRSSRPACRRSSRSAMHQEPTTRVEGWPIGGGLQAARGRRAPTSSG